MATSSVEIDEAQVKRLEVILRDTPKRLKRALGAAVSDTTRKLRTRISTKIRSKVAIKKKDIDQYIKIRVPRANETGGSVQLKEGPRLPLKYFGAKQTKKGVTYRIDKGKRKRVPDAFGPNIPRLGNHVFKREGKPRFPIVKLHGLSPWGLFVKAGLEGPTNEEAQAELNKQVERRINFEIVKIARDNAPTVEFGAMREVE